MGFCTHHDDDGKPSSHREARRPVTGKTWTRRIFPRRAADALAVPSRQDNLPNTGVEAHACATPVIAFDTGGLPDIVVHQQTGYLAKPFDTQDLARGIAWVLCQAGACQLSAQARQRAVARFDAAAVASAYRQLYAEVLSH